VTSGNLRKRTGKDSSGKGLDFDSDEDDDALLRKIRNKRASALVLDDIDEEDKTSLQKLGKFFSDFFYKKTFIKN
jgi:hypothetical protein